jgi:hypothetical protein
MKLLRVLLGLVPHAIVAAVLFPLAVFVMWGLERYIPAQVTPNRWVHGLAAIASFTVACFVASVGFLALFPAVGLLRAMLSREKARGVVPIYIPGPDTFKKARDSKSTASAEELKALKTYERLICCNACAMRLEIGRNYQEAFDRVWPEAQSQ